jgi:acyl-CoA synthetase (AMP-forming)/AMP-acid ligase II
MVSPKIISQIIMDEGENSPDYPAILSPGKETISYRVLSKHLHSTALLLTRLGIRPGDRLAVVLPNGPEMATAFLAISAVCTCAPLNPSSPLEDFKFSMVDLHIKALVTSLVMDHPSRKAAFDLGIPVFDLEPDELSAGIFTLTCEMPVDDTIHEPILMGMDDVALVLHTSGTTSRPKIVPLTHRNIFYSLRNIAEAYKLEPTDRCLNMMPLFHVHGLIGAVATSLLSGASVICAPGFLSHQVLGWLTEMGPTWYTAVPTIHQALLDQAIRQPEIVECIKLRLIRSCSSPLAPQLARDLELTFSAPVLEAYGMTEATHQIASNPLPPLPHKYGSVGMATGSNRISIVDEQGNILQPNSAGEICIQGENVITGYENNPKANQDGFLAGWLRTGDLGYLDEDGYLFIQGRLKEIINRAGEKISPREIDEVLQQHPAVRQAAAFAVPHPSLGEDVGAAIVLHTGHTVSVQELRQFSSEHLADFKVPRLIVFVNEIPKGATGKVQRIGLAEILKSELESYNVREPAGAAGPRNPLEAELLSIWQGVIQRQLGIHDDFLAIGNSLQAARIVLLVNERFGTELDIIDIFTASTVELMAGLIQEKISLNSGHD